MKQIAKFVVGLGDRVAPTDIEEGMRVGYVAAIRPLALALALALARYLRLATGCCLRVSVESIQDRPLAFLFKCLVKLLLA